MAADHQPEGKAVEWPKTIWRYVLHRAAGLHAAGQWNVGDPPSEQERLFPGFEAVQVIPSEPVLTALDRSRAHIANAEAVLESLEHGEREDNDDRERAYQRGRIQAHRDVLEALSEFKGRNDAE